MEKARGLTGILALCAVGSGLLTSGCGDMLTTSVGWQGPEIKRPELVADIQEVANEKYSLFQKETDEEKKIKYGRTAFDMFTAIGDYTKAREIAKSMLIIDADRGLRYIKFLDDSMPPVKEK